MLKKGNWQERESVTDVCHDRPGKPGKRGDKKLGQNSSERRFSDARQLGCVFQDMTPPKSILRKSTDMPKTIQRVKLTKAIARHTKIRDQNPSLGYICPGALHERSPNAPKFEDRSQEETEWQEQGAREAAWKLAKNVLKLKEHQKATFFSPSENRCLPASTLKLEERKFVVDSGASMHMISKKDLSDAEMDTLTKSCSPTIVITANGEVQTHEEANVYVKELDIFLTMKVLDNTPAVLSLGKLCDENGYSYEWINGLKPHLIKDGIRIICNTENFVPIVVPGLSSSSSASSSTSRTPMKQESHSSSSSSSSPSSPTVDEISVREREVAPNSDISPVPVSEFVDDRSGKPVETQANEIPKPKKKETTIERGNPCDVSEIPEWLQEFRENLVDDEIPLQGCSHGGDRLRPISTSASFFFRVRPIRLRPISTSANIDFGQFRLRPISTSANFWMLNFWAPKGWGPQRVEAQTQKKVGPRRVEAPKGGGPEGWSPEGWRPRAAGARTRQPENSKRAHFRVPALQTPPNSTKGPQERERRMKIVAGGGKKERNFGRSGGGLSGGGLSGGGGSPEGGSSGRVHRKWGAGFGVSGSGGRKQKQNKKQNEEREE